MTGLHLYAHVVVEASDLVITPQVTQAHCVRHVGIKI